MVIIVMGITGAGKTTVGTALAGTCGWQFVDGDDLHPTANVAKMRAGIPLNDQDRAPWLAAIAGIIDRALDRREPCVIACSALKARYRATLKGDRRGIRFVFLDVPSDVAASRAGRRTGHFAGPALVASQFSTLERPTDALIVDGTLPPEAIVATVRRAFGI